VLFTSGLQLAFDRAGERFHGLFGDVDS
jgi:hypothetical protein